MIKIKKNSTLKKNKTKKNRSLKNKIEIQNTNPIKIMNKNYLKMTNDKIVAMLEKMEKIMFMDGENFKARAYSKAKETMMLVKPCEY